MLDDLIAQWDEIRPFRSSLRFAPLKLGWRLDLNRSGEPDKPVYFSRSSKNWVAARTAKGGGAHEPGLVRCMILLARLLPPDRRRVFYDVGALHGYVSLLAGSVLAPEAVCAFEMNPRAARLARQNFALNRRLGARLSVVEAGVSRKSERDVPCAYRSFVLRLRPPEDTHQALLAEGFQFGPRDLITLDDFCAEAGAPPDIVKIDVEGSQMSVLEGAARLLRDTPPVLLIELDSPEAANADGTPMAVLATHLLDRGYELATVRHRGWDDRPRRVTAADIAARPKALDHNQLLIAVPRV